MARTIPFRKKYKKLFNKIFTTIRPETGTDYYADGEIYEIYHRKNFVFAAMIVKQTRNVKLKDIPLDIIKNDVDPPHNTKEDFFNLMENMYKDNYYRPDFWKGWDTPFRIIWLKRVAVLRRWV